MDMQKIKSLFEINEEHETRAEAFKRRYDRYVLEINEMSPECLIDEKRIFIDKVYKDMFEMYCFYARSIRKIEAMVSGEENLESKEVLLHLRDIFNSQKKNYVYSLDEILEQFNAYLRAEYFDDFD